MTAFTKRAFFVFIGCILVIVFSACGVTTSTGTPAVASTSILTSHSPIPTTTTSTSTVQVVQATVNGKATTILTDAQGRTLYYYTPDTPTKLACKGGCAKAWPPLLFTGSGTPTSATPLPGTLRVMKNANGRQVEY
ncbi:MAG TPA: hypothetical protein VIY29_01870, partial [Ktedonobacteraceae bacterium]